MPKYAVQPSWRSRRAAIGKKGELDYELLMDSELTIIKPGKQRVGEATSPTSVASSFSSPTTVATSNFDMVPEMKPLPGAWVTVGKGGRPVKESLMYHEPAKTQVKSKKKRVRARKDRKSEDAPLDDYLASLEEAPSTSKCLQAIGRSTEQRQKELDRLKESKHWKEYRQAKQLKALARDHLIVALVDGGLLDDVSEGTVVAPEPPKRRNDKGSSHGAKCRRKARLAAAAARCYSVEMGEDEPLVEMPIKSQPTAVAEPKVSKPKMVAEKAKVLTSDEQAATARDSPAGLPIDKDGSDSSSSAGLEIPAAKQPSLPNGKPLKAKRDSKNCTVM